MGSATAAESAFLSKIPRKFMASAVPAMVAAMNVASVSFILLLMWILALRLLAV
jgi:hypothetical protein